MSQTLSPKQSHKQKEQCPDTILKSAKSSCSENLVQELGMMTTPDQAGSEQQRSD